MITTIFLVRHGQTESNITSFFVGRSEEDLNQAGYDQARSLSARMKDMPLSSVYTSPLKRTCTTASILAEPHGLELNLRDELLEIDLGDWQGLYIDEISRRWPELWRQSRLDPSDVTPPHGESFQKVRERVAQAFDSIALANQGKQVAIVTHEVGVKMIVIHALGATSSIYRRFEIGNASLSVIRINDDRPTQLIALNDISHL